MSVDMQTCPSCGDQVPNEYILCVWCGHDLTAEKIRRSGIRIGNREAIIRMRGVIVDPITSFKQIALLPDLRGPKMILYAIGVMMTFNMLAIFSKLDGLTMNTDLGEIDLGINVSIKFLLNLVIILVQPLVLFIIFMVIWKISARILALISKSVGGKGDREKIRSAVGYSLLPVLLGWTLAWLVRLLTPTSDTIPSTTYENIQAAVTAVSEEGLGFIGLIFIWVGWIWSTVLGIIGMKNVGRLSWVEAVLVTGIPYGIFISIIL